MSSYQLNQIQFVHVHQVSATMLINLSAAHNTHLTTFALSVVRTLQRFTHDLQLLGRPVTGRDAQNMLHFFRYVDLQHIVCECL